MLGEFNKARKEKTSLAKYSIEFNDFTVQTRPHRNTVFGDIRETLHITVCEKVCGLTTKYVNTDRQKEKT